MTHCFPQIYLPDRWLLFLIKLQTGFGIFEVAHCGLYFYVVRTNSFFQMSPQKSHSFSSCVCCGTVQQTPQFIHCAVRVVTDELFKLQQMPLALCE